MNNKRGFLGLIGLLITLVIIALMSVYILKSTRNSSALPQNLGEQGGYQNIYEEAENQARDILDRSNISY